MKITNKIESINKIKILNLNKFPEALFRKGEEAKVKEFMDKYPVKYYALRDSSRAHGYFNLTATCDTVLEEIQKYELFTINVSSANYVDNQLLVGEIKCLSGGEIQVTLSKDPKASAREAVRNPHFNFKTDIFDKRLKEIPQFDLIYDYIVKNNLLDVIVEFALFDIEVGIKKEKIIIYELRTDY